MIRGLLSVLIVLLAGFLDTGHAAQPPLALGDDQSSYQIAGHVDYFIDPTRDLTLADIFAGSPDIVFAAVEAPTPNFGAIKGMIWLRIDLEGASSEPRAWIASFNVNFMQGLAAYVVREDGRTETILSQTLASPFSSRPIPTDQLAARFHLDAGERARIFIAYWSGGATGLPLSIESERAFLTTLDRTTAKHFAFYGVMLLFMVAGFVTGALLRRHVFFAFGAYAGAVVLFVAQMDGAAFHYLWPGSPSLNGYISLPLGTLLIIAASHYVRSFLQTRRRQPVFDRVILGLISLAVLILAASAFADTQVLKTAMTIVAGLATLIFTLAGLDAARTRLREVRFFIAGWLVAFVSAGLLIANQVIGLGVPRILAIDSIRFATVLETMLMGAAIVDRFLQLRQSYMHSLRTANETLSANAALQLRLAELEERYTRAQDLADRDGRRLADAAHDLRQPIFALRASVLGLLRGTKDKTRRATERENIERSFTYIENLLEHTLDGQDSGTVISESADCAASASVNQLLDNLHDMFAGEAASRGVDLRVLPSTATTSGNTLAIMRVLSNLVSNAIKYAGPGRVLVGCRRRRNRLCFEVHDEGPGMPPEVFESARHRSVRLDISEEDPGGHGLGLAIVHQLCAEHALQLEHIPRRSGTSIRLVS